MRSLAPYLVSAVALSLLSAGLIYSHVSFAIMDPNVTLAQASDNVFQPRDFSLSGPITSLVYNQNVTYILQGNWSMSVNNGRVTTFDSNFTALSNDGQQLLSFQLSNFTAKTNLTPERNHSILYAFGTVDVISNSTVEKVPVNLNIANMKVLTITLGSSDTASILAGQPVYGTAVNPQTHVASAHMLPEANGAVQLGNVTPGLRSPQLPFPIIK